MKDLSREEAIREIKASPSVQGKVIMRYKADGKIWREVDFSLTRKEEAVFVIKALEDIFKERKKH